MLTILAYLMIIVFMTLIMTKRLPALVALITVPIIFGLIAGFGVNDLGPMMLAGVTKLAPTGVMLMFAILYFGVMIDAGLFDPIVRFILKIVGGDPMKIVVGTSALAMAVGLDGDGSTTYMVTAAAMLPLYTRLGMSKLVFACVVMMAGHNMNLLPWGGPTARATSALGLDVSQVFVPLIPAMIVTGIWALFVAYLLGMRERRRVGMLSAEAMAEGAIEISDEEAALRRPKLLWFNALLTVALIVALVMSLAPLPILFMVAFAIAISVNYPGLQAQKERMEHHAGNALPVVGLIFAAGIFVGILSGTKMVDAIAASVIAAVPDWLGPYMAVVTAVLSIPFTFFISNDAFYFGILPILAKTAAVYGFSPAEIARASLIGQQVHLLSPLVASTYLLVGLAKVEFGDHQRFTLLWAMSAAGVMLLATLLLGIVPLVGHPG